MYIRIYILHFHNIMTEISILKIFYITLSDAGRIFYLISGKIQFWLASKKGN